MLVTRAERVVQRACPGLDLDAAHVAPADGGDLPSGDDDLADRAAVGQQTVQIGREKSGHAALPAADGNGAQELIERLLPLRAFGAEAAGQPHQLADGRVEDWHGLAHGLIELRVARAERNVAPQRAERLPLPIAELRDRSGTRALLFPHE